MTLKQQRNAENRRRASSAATRRREARPSSPPENARVNAKTSLPGSGTRSPTAGFSHCHDDLRNPSLRNHRLNCGSERSARVLSRDRKPRQSDLGDLAPSRSRRVGARLALAMARASKNVGAAGGDRPSPNWSQPERRRGRGSVGASYDTAVPECQFRASIDVSDILDGSVVGSVALRPPNTSKPLFDFVWMSFISPSRP
jgi:hypothetical protein